MMEILINAQWQGGADTVTFDGAKELAEIYLNGQTPVYSPVSAQIQSGHVYIHLDLDVIDPADFPDTPLPVDNGLHFGEVYGILKAFSDNLVGLGIFEYARLGAKNDYIEKLIRFGLAL